MYNDLRAFYKPYKDLADLDLTGLPLWKAIYTQAVYEGGKPEWALYTVEWIKTTHRLAKTNFNYGVLWEKATLFQHEFAVFEFKKELNRMFDRSSWQVFVFHDNMEIQTPPKTRAPRRVKYPMIYNPEGEE